MKRTVIKGERKVIMSKNSKGVDTPRTGKNGGPCIEQLVVIEFDPNK